MMRTLTSWVLAAARSWTVCGLALVVGEVVLTALVVLRRGYTEIDWRTYMEQVGLVVDGGERNYAAIRGQQGPLVYPAGFVWLFAALRHLTRGGDIHTAQRLFAGLYVCDQAVMARIYALALSDTDDDRRFPPYLLALLAISKRAHSVFALRLFNDGPCALLSHVAVWLLIESCRGQTNKTSRRRSWLLTLCCYVLACATFSLAVSVKMSAILYAPAWYVVSASTRGHAGAVLGVLVSAATQLLIAAPFLTAAPVAYLSRAFDLGRGFKHKWSVNFKWVACETLSDAETDDLRDCRGPFASSTFKVTLLALHASCLVALAHFRWRAAGGKKKKKNGGGFASIFSRDPRREYSPLAVATMLFSSNFVGLAFARSLHFQFSVWYLNSLPLLVIGATTLPFVLKITILLAVEAAWNPWRPGDESSSVASSILLTGAHVLILAGLFFANAVPDFAVDLPRQKQQQPVVLHTDMRRQKKTA